MFNLKLFIEKFMTQKKGERLPPLAPEKKEPPLILFPLKIEAPQKLAQLF